MLELLASPDFWMGALFIAVLGIALYGVVRLAVYHELERRAGRHGSGRRR